MRSRWAWGTYLPEEDWFSLLKVYNSDVPVCVSNTTGNAQECNINIYCKTYDFCNERMAQNIEIDTMTQNTESEGNGWIKYGKPLYYLRIMIPALGLLRFVFINF